MQVEPLDAALKSKLADLRQVLETIMQRIATGEDIVGQLGQIDTLYRELTLAEAPKMLLHYLERKSYTKALEFLRTL